MFSPKALCMLAVLGVVGCGGCPQVKQHRQDFLTQQQVVPTSHRQHPHILLEIPRTLIDRTLDKTLKALPSVGFNLKGLGEVGRFMERLSIKAKDIRMELDRVKDARLLLDLDVRYGRRVLFGVHLAARAPVEYNTKTGIMRIIIRHDLFEKVEPRIDREAIGQVTSSITGKMPGFTKALIPQSLVRKYAKKGIQYLTRDLYGLIRKEILTPMGEMTRFSFTLRKYRCEKSRSGRIGMVGKSQRSQPFLPPASSPRNRLPRAIYSGLACRQTFSRKREIGLCEQGNYRRDSTTKVELGRMGNS